MPPRLVLATRNRHKIEEVHRILAATQYELDIIGLDAYPDVSEVRETGATFADNAVLKARTVSDTTQEPAIADDSGLAVDALNGMPGVFSARWAGRYGDDLTNLELLLAQLVDVPGERRGATFVCAAAIAFPDRRQRVVEGTVRGRLVREPRGTHGFGYDPIFVPDGETRTMAELDPDEKDAISHRGKAFRQLISEVMPDLARR
jgi:XTP/dITP diphosphohydrolase